MQERLLYPAIAAEEDKEQATANFIWSMNDNQHFDFKEWKLRPLKNLRPMKGSQRPSGNGSAAIVGAQVS